MTKQQRDELNKLRIAEFMSEDEEKMRDGFRQLKELLRHLEEESGMTRMEALAFVASLFAGGMQK